MGPDERAIREVHSSWIEAVNAGDLARLLGLMADDVVFLNPGRAPLGRDGFPTGFSAAHQQNRIRCLSELEEVVRSEERRVGKEGRCRWSAEDAEKEDAV